MIYELPGVQPVLWLISHTDELPVQKLNALPIDPMKQVAKLCISFGMTRIKLEKTIIEIGGQPIIGFCVSCKGFDIVPFVGNIILGPSTGVEYDLQQVWGKWGDEDEESKLEN